MSDDLFTRILLPITPRTDAVTVCEAVGHYVNEETETLIVTRATVDGEGRGEDREGHSKDPQGGETGGQVETIRAWFDADPVTVEERTASAATLAEAVFDVAVAVDATVVGVVPRADAVLGGALAGDEVAKFSSQTECPVVVIPHPARSETEDGEAERPVPGQRILVPIDGSERSIRALDHACTAHPNGEIVAIHVLEDASSDIYESMTGGPSTDVEEFERERRTAVDSLFAEAERLASDHDVSIETRSETGSVARAIVSTAERTDVDGIVMASRNRNPVSEVLLGSVSRRVVRRSPVPVTVLR